MSFCDKVLQYAKIDVQHVFTTKGDAPDHASSVIAQIVRVLGSIGIVFRTSCCERLNSVMGNFVSQIAQIVPQGMFRFSRF